MHTGDGDISQFGVVKEWNYSPDLPYYPGSCSEVRGSGGEFYPPEQDQENPITIFNGELCRPLDMYFTEETTAHGVSLNKYAATTRSFDNGSMYSEFECFSAGDSVPSGVMNISACRLGAPVFVSFPHFYAADPYFLQFVDGLKPEKEKHEFYIAMEPFTAVTLEVAARLQVNLLVRPMNYIAMYEDVPYMFFPVIWFEQKVLMPEEFAAQIRLAVLAPTVGYCIAIFMIVIGFSILFYTKYYKKDFNDDNEKGNDDVVRKTVKILPEISPLMKEKLEKSKINEAKQHARAPLAIGENDSDFNSVARK